MTFDVRGTGSHSNARKKNNKKNKVSISNGYRNAERRPAYSPTQRYTAEIIE